MKLLLHAGVHLAGDMEIQQECCEFSAILSEAGLYWPDPAPAPAHHWLPAIWNPGIPETWRLPDPAGHLEALRNKTHDTLFLSSQEIWRLKPVHHSIDMLSFRKMFDRFDQVQVVLVLPEPDWLIPMIWKKISHERGPNLWEEAFSEVISEKMIDGLTIDYEALHNFLCGGFHEEEISILPYSQLRQHPDGMLVAFLEALGYSEAANGLIEARRAASSKGTTHVDAGMAREHISHLAYKIASPRKPKSVLFTAIRRIYALRCADMAIHSLLSPSETRDLHRAVGLRNDRFWRRYAPSYAEERLQKKATGSELPIEFWLDLAKRLKSLSSWGKA